MGPDAYYTPTGLADTIVRAAGRVRPKLVLDPAVGNGSLLRSAKVKWPTAEFVGVDIAVDHQTELDDIGVQMGRCNFLNHRSRSQCRSLEGIAGRVDLVLMNPPFSNRAWSHVNVVMNETEFEVSTPLAFVMIALKYLAHGGRVVAIVPRGVIDSARDRRAIDFLTRSASLDLVHEIPKRTFKGTSASSIVVTLSNPAGKDRSRPGNGHSVRRATDPPAPLRSTSPILATLIRGTMPMHEAKIAERNGIQLVHSTDLTRLNGSTSLRRVSACRRTATGPAVLVPRVGKPSPGHVVVYREGGPLGLSDCVIALETGDAKDADRLRDLILANWLALADLYRGSCAPYIRVAQLVAYLGDLNVDLRFASITPQLTMALQQEQRS